MTWIASASPNGGTSHAEILKSKDSRDSILDDLGAPDSTYCDRHLDNISDVPGPACQGEQAQQLQQEDVPSLRGSSIAASEGQEVAGHGAGFSKWMRGERAKGDAFGFYLSLVFHTITLSKWRTLPPAHLLYFVLYTLATLGALAWQRSRRPSYASWRDWIQAAIRLDVFLTPYRIVIWQQSAHNLPPSLPGHPLLSWGASLPVVVANTMAVHLLMLPLAHPLSLWPHLAVQLVCVGRAVHGAASFQACTMPFFRHPTARCILAQMHEWLQLLHLVSVVPVGTEGASPRCACSQRCAVAVVWLQVMCGVVVSVPLRAVRDLQAFKDWQQRGQPGRRSEGTLSKAPGWAGLWGVYDAVCDSLNARLLRPLAGMCMNPCCWVLAAGGVLGVAMLLSVR